MFIAIKPCRFDRDYIIGEVILDEAILPCEVDRLISYGLITKLADVDAPPPVTVVPNSDKADVTAEDDGLPLTEKKLLSKTKPQLLQLSEKFGLTLDKKMAIPEMAAAILIAQEIAFADGKSLPATEPPLAATSDESEENGGT